MPRFIVDLRVETDFLKKVVSGPSLCSGPATTTQHAMRTLQSKLLTDTSVSGFVCVHEGLSNCRYHLEVCLKYVIIHNL